MESSIFQCEIHTLCLAVILGMAQLHWSLNLRAMVNRCIRSWDASGFCQVSERLLSSYSKPCRYKALAQARAVVKGAADFPL